MNTYRIQFFCQCPINSVRIFYTLVIESKTVVIVENLIGMVSDFPPALHEHIADRLHAAFGGKQTMSASHHGVEIVTVRE